MAQKRDKKSRREVVELATAILLAITSLIDLIKALLSD